MGLGIVWMGLLQILSVLRIEAGILENRSSSIAVGKYIDDDDDDDNLPILIIGGTDGSGTRAFVDTIKRLGVIIVADDLNTFDVHAGALFHGQGWPALVNTVLKHTHSGDYEWDDLPNATRRILAQEIPKFLKPLKVKYKRQKKLQRQQHQLGFGPHSPKAKGVSFAMKAPVAMLVLPVLTKFMGKVKFMHVLRE
jgi:hypothetical protein